MVKSYEELKESFTLLNELQADYANKMAIMNKVEARYQELKNDLDQAKEQRKEVFEKKLLGQASYSDLEQLDSKIQALEKEMTVVTEELEVVKTYPKKPLYDNHKIYSMHRDFMNEHIKTEFPSVEAELKAAKEAYMEKFNAYVEEREKLGKLGREVIQYLNKFNNDAYYNFPKMPPINEDLLINLKK